MRAGYIGLGHIGRGMARELVLAGHATSVYDLMPEGPAELAAAGAYAASSPKEVAERADIVGVCVRTDQDVLDVFGAATGLLAGARPGLLVLVHSTIRPATLHTVADMARANGVRVVDAPVSRASMEPSGKIIAYMLGGAAADIEEAKRFVEPSAKSITVAGGIGAAMALKIANNLATYIQLVAAFEAYGLATKCGLEPQTLIDVMTSNGNATPTMLAIMRGWQRSSGVASEAQQAHAAQFTAIAHKDLDCALEAAADIGLDLAAGKTARAEIARVMQGIRQA